MCGKHRELERAKIQKSEDAVQRTILVIQNFTNPFSIPDKNHLCNIASGAPSPPDVEYDVLHAEKIGKEAKPCFFICVCVQVINYEILPTLRILCCFFCKEGDIFWESYYRHLLLV